MDAGVAVALVHFGQALGVVEALRAEAGEAVDAVLARAPVVAGIAGTLVDVNVAHAPWERGSKNSYSIRMDGTAWGEHPSGNSPSSHPGNVCWRLGSRDTRVLAAEQRAALQAG